MKRLIDQLKSNKGSGIVTVLVAILFLSAFGTLSLYLAYTSTEMVTSERRGREATYNAETCMEEIKAGLQITVSDAIAKSYNEIMPKYTSYNQDISDEFNKLYLDSVLGAKVINYDGTVNPEDGGEDSDDAAAHKIVYFNDKLFSIEKQANGLYKPKGTYECAQLARLIKETRGGTCSVFSGSPDKTKGVLELTNKEIIIKDITVSYETGGRKSSVTSDISIGIPDLGYFMTQYAISGIPDFSLICKGELSQTVSGKTAQVYGSAYANNVNLKSDSQFILGNGGAFIIKNDLKISGGKVDENRFTTNANTSLWAKDIIIEDSTVANFTGSTYVNNDLEFNGINSKVNLSGTYYGFGCDASDPANSSSIIFNHATGDSNKNELNISGLSDLVLAGVSFVSNNDRFIQPDNSVISQSDIDNYNEERYSGLLDKKYSFNHDDIKDENDEILYSKDSIGARTGMSMDAKFNQVIYFAPKGEVTPYLFKTRDFEVNGDKKSLIYMTKKDEDGTEYFADYNNGTPVFYKLSPGTDSNLEMTTGVAYNPQVYAGTLETDADGISFYTIKDLNNVAFFALNGEEYEYNSVEKRFLLKTHSSAAFPDNVLKNKKYSNYNITLQPIFQPLSGGIIEVTFFMKFNDTEDPVTHEVTIDAQKYANQFFVDYFNASEDNKQKIINNIEAHTNIITDSQTRRRTVGNTISKLESENYDIINALTEAFNSIKAEAETVKNVFNQFCIGLASKIDPKDIPSQPEKRNPYDYYIKDADIKRDIANGSELRFYNNEGFTGLIVNGDFTYSGGVYSDLHILIATGNVTVEGTFNGLIIAGGDIVLKETCTLNKYAEGVANAYNADTIDDKARVEAGKEPHKHDSTKTIDNVPDRILKDYFKMDISKEFMYSSSRSGDAWNVEGLVTYKNWHR